MKPLINTITGILATIAVGFYMNSMLEYSGGAGQTPREMMADYFAMTYEQGKGVDARQEYFAPDAEDNTPDSPEGRNGPPIGHEIKQIISDGLQLMVFHRVGTNSETQAVDVIDIYRIERGKIVKRYRVLDDAESS